MLTVALLLAILCSDVVEVSTTHETSFVVFPQDCNANPPMLFGGKILAEMDRCAGITTRRFLYSSPHGVRDAVTVGITDVAFISPGKVKDLIFVRGTIVDVGDKSIKVKVEVEREALGKRELISRGTFIFVAYDAEKQQSVRHGLGLK